MTRTRHALPGLLLVLLVGQFAIANTGISYSGEDYTDTESLQTSTGGNQGIRSPTKHLDNGVSLSDDTISGFFDPAGVEQTGIRMTDQLAARTDTSANTTTSISIDNAIGWVGSEAEIEVTDLQRLYGVNGTFDDGIDGTNTYTDPENPVTTAYPYGWDVDVYEPAAGSDQLQESTYDNSTGYVSVENQGEERTSPSLLYWHFNNTYIMWNQTVQNTPYSNNFTMNFKFNYDSGVIDNTDWFTPYGEHVLLVAYVHDTFYNITDLLANVPSRNTWYSHSMQFNLPDGVDTFEIGFGIYYLSYYDDYIEFNPGGDYDDDGAIDGDLCRVFRVLIDDVSFVGLDSPGFDEVDLKFHAGSTNTSISGTAGNGTATITNQSYWSDSSLPIEVTSNVSVSCYYHVNLISHRFDNTSYTTQATKTGTAYSIASGASVELTTYTYVGAVADYENYTVFIDYPMDWENATVYDPFLNDVTPQCIIATGRIAIPTSLLDRLGWWQITLDAPNYAKSIFIQEYNEGSGLWDNSTIFRTGNTSRTQVTLGTDVSIPNLSDPVNLTWSLPNASIWSEESLTGGFNGQVNSTSLVLGALNTSAGQWSVSVSWTNGTELAYGNASFDMYHTATLTPKHTEIQTESGLVVTNFLYYVDADNGEYLMDEMATIEGNWSSSTLTFNPNLLHNWWETDFDSAVVGGGVHLVIVNASRPYFDNVSCDFIIESTLLTQFSLFFESGAPIEIGLNETHSYEFRYELLDGTGIDDALVDVSFSPTVGLNVSSPTNTAPGNYSLEIYGVQSGIYTVIVSANKSYHETQYATFSLTVAAVPTVLIPSASGGVISLDQIYTLQLSFEDEFGTGLPKANITVLSPPAGLLFYDAIDLGGGLYNVTIEPLVDEATTFEILFRATLENYQSSTTAFSLMVRTIPTSLVILEGGSSESILFTEHYTLTLVFVRTDTNENVSSAHLDVFVIPSEGLNWTIRKTGVIYEVTFIAETVGKWQVFLTANKTQYMSTATQFELEVGVMDSSVNQITLVEALVYDRAYDFTFTYLMLNGTGITDAEVAPSGVGREWFSVSQGSLGQYVVTLIPQGIGSFEVTFSFSKDGFAAKSSAFSFNVVEVTIEVANIQGLSGAEDQLTIISLGIIESDTEQPVTGATVVVQVVVNLVPAPGVQLEEVGEGQYSGQFIMPSSDTTAEIRIYVSLEHYVLDDEYFQTELNPEMSTFALLTRTAQQYSPLLVLIGAIVVGFIVQKVQSRRRKAEYIEALVVKRRFDDVRNLLGVIVLHRTSGIPIYSKLLKDGFDDSMLSGFIAAITQFRAEFEVDQKEWQIIPISDIIRTVSTQNLICAFITLGSPTGTQEEQMMQFARAIAFIFDSHFENAPINVLDDETEDRFETLFEEMLDGALLVTYRTVEAHKLPRNLRFLEKGTSMMDNHDEFELEELASIMTRSGLEEARAYKTIMEGIEIGYLEPIELEPYTDQIDDSD
ncbi:MAG: hypothetical protein RTU09_05180 [Candidatus Thorarchaeota archaeon]